MTVTDIRKDPAALTMTIASEWNAPIARVWQLWADPRKLERWWGPPTYPATFETFDFQPGGRALYFMTGLAQAGHDVVLGLPLVDLLLGMPLQRVRWHQALVGQDQDAKFSHRA